MKESLSIDEIHIHQCFQTDLPLVSATRLSTPNTLNELKFGENYEVEFLNGSKAVVKFTAHNSGRYYFLNKDGQQFSIAENCIQYLRFYKFG